MKETKVYVDELPESCFECPIMVDGSEGCDFCVCAILEEKAITKNRLKDCPLKSLHDHDKELVARVLKEVEDTFTQYLPLKNRTGAWFYGRLNEILKKYQKEFEDGYDENGEEVHRQVYTTYQQAFNELVLEAKKLRQQLKEKDKEIELLKHIGSHETNMELFKENTKLIIEKRQFTIQELEKVKTLIQNAINFEKPNFAEVYDAINKQINELKGEKK